MAFLILAVPFLCRLVGKDVGVKLFALFWPVGHTRGLQGLRNEDGGRRLKASLIAWMVVLIGHELLCVLLPSQIGVLFVDIILSVIGLALLVPVLVIAALAIFAFSSGHR